MNLQAHPSGLKAFPELNGSFWDLPSGNLTSTTFPQSEEAEPQNSDYRLQIVHINIVHSWPYHGAGPVWACGSLVQVSGWEFSALKHGVTCFVPRNKTWGFPTRQALKDLSF